MRYTATKIAALMAITGAYAIGCTPTAPILAPSPHTNTLAKVEHLAQLMQGSFSSEVQAATDDNFYDIRLEMVRIWPLRKDAVWLYVEQAAAQNLDRPYRQRVYKLTQQGERFVSAVYTLDDPLQYAGQWAAPSSFDSIGPSDLTERRGCEVFLKRVADHRFAGSTHSNNCTSTLRGASYATSEVSITSNGIESWDRGFDANNQQVWGAVTGPYQFRR